MAEHDGHRKRMRQRFLRHGLGNFDDHSVLELLLFYAVPRKDTNLLAHRLMETFGSLDRVFEALPEELTAVEGVGENAAALIRLVPAAAQRYLIAKESHTDILPDVESVGKYLIPRFMNLRTETVMMLSLDTKLKVLDCRTLGSGALNAVDFSARDVVQTALLHNARYVVLAHNHLSGIAIPSREDISVTKSLHSVLSSVGVELLDHIIVAGQDFVSLADDHVI